jgi:hypothetical protein
LKKHAPLIRANLRIWSKIRVILEWSKFVSACVERSKKFSKNLFFAPTPLRILAVISIEILKKTFWMLDS